MFNTLNPNKFEQWLPENKLTYFHDKDRKGVNLRDFQLTNGYSSNREINFSTILNSFPNVNFIYISFCC